MRLVTLEHLDKILYEFREKFFFKRQSESVSLLESIGRILAEDVYSNKTLPLYDIATMDGYAVNSLDPPPLKLIGEVFPDSPIRKIEKGYACYITTGAPLPEGADAVVKIEEAELTEEGLFFQNITSGRYVLKKGTDFKENELIVEAGRRISPQEIAMMVVLHIDEIKVFKKYRVGIIATGDEIKKGIVKDVNSFVVASFIKQWGEEPVLLGTAGDDYEELKELMLQGLVYCDALITTGGVSVGKKDFVIKVIEDEGELVLHKVRVRPGKPMAIGVIKNKPVFALPGKPAGAFIAMLSLRKFFLGNIPFPKIKMRMKKTVKIPTPGFEYIIFIKNVDGYAYPVGYKDSPLSIIPENSNYQPSLISNAVKSLLADGFVTTQTDLEKDQVVDVNLF
ncbi:molybdopterin molybdotransferase MoeA [Thermodesulfovibrio sp. TK110]